MEESYFLVEVEEGKALILRRKFSEVNVNEGIDSEATCREGLLRPSTSEAVQGLQVDR